MAIVTEAHLSAFGKIIYFYATVEWGIRCMMAGVIETPLVEALVLTEPYTAASLKNVAKSATKLSRLSKADQEKFIQIVGDWGGFSGIRNAIAHRRWEKGAREGSIRPVGVDIRSGKAKLVGDIEDRDWTEAELLDEAKKLHELNERAKTFYFESGISDAIAAKDKERTDTKSEQDVGA